MAGRHEDAPVTEELEAVVPFSPQCPVHNDGPERRYLARDMADLAVKSALLSRALFVTDPFPAAGVQETRKLSDHLTKRIDEMLTNCNLEGGLAFNRSRAQIVVDALLLTKRRLTDRLRKKGKGLKGRKGKPEPEKTSVVRRLEALSKEPEPQPSKQPDRTESVPGPSSSTDGASVSECCQKCDRTIPSTEPVLFGPCQHSFCFPCGKVMLSNLGGDVVFQCDTCDTSYHLIRLRRGSDEDEYDCDTVFRLCQGCHDLIREREFVFLAPCRHGFCMECAKGMLVNHGLGLTFECRSCELHFLDITVDGGQHTFLSDGDSLFLCPSDFWKMLRKQLHGSSHKDCTISNCMLIK